MSTPTKTIIDISFKPKFKVSCYKDFIDDLKFNGEPFVITGSTFTKKINCYLGGFKASRKADIPMHELYFIKRVNDYITDLHTFYPLELALCNGGLMSRKDLVKIPTVDAKKIFYMNRSVFSKKTLTKELYEIDLTAAYWSLAHKERFISEEIYKEGLTLSKKIRLVSLGALAKSILTMAYDGEKFTDIIKEKLHVKANVFFKVSLLTDIHLKTAYLTLGKNALFYWVDALFLRGKDNYDIAKTYFNDNGLQFKTYKIDKVIFAGHKITVHSKDYNSKHKNKKGKPREFNFKK